MSQNNIKDIELAVLVKVIKEPNAIYSVLGYLKPQHFSVTQYGLIYASIERLLNNNSDIGYLLVLSDLDNNGSLEKAGGKDFVAGVFDSTPVADDIKDLVELIVQNFKYRSAVQIGYDLTALHKLDYKDIDNNLSQISQSIDNLLAGSADSHTESINDVLRDEWQDFEKLLEKPGITGISTGNDSLDLMLSGYNPTNLIIIAARTGVGKSSYALRQMLNMSKANIPTLMFSYEMSKKELSQRMVSMESGVPLLNIRTGNVSDKELEVIKNTYLKVSTYPIYLDTSASDSLSYLLSTIRRYVRTSGVKVVFVDYLQLMARNTDNLVRDLGKVTKALKLLAMELDIVIVALSQINRGVESRDNKRPQLFDLRDSGNIEEDANIVLMLYRPALSGVKMKDEDEFLCEILVRKNRNGPLGAINAYFKAENADIVNSLTEIIRSLK